MYRQLRIKNGDIRTDTILRISDNAQIPNDLMNRDWADYQEWLTYGNSPLPPEGE